MPNKDKKTKAKKDLEQKCDEYLAGWKRAQADYQNLQKEMEIRRKEYVEYANEDIIKDFLPILDNFKAAFRQIPDSEQNSAWVTGFSYIKKQLEGFLEARGLELIKTVGEAFDPEKHEAVEYIEDGKIDDNVVIEERRSGYVLNNKVVQVAKVVVAKSDNEQENKSKINEHDKQDKQD